MAGGFSKGLGGVLLGLGIAFSVAAIVAFFYGMSEVQAAEDGFGGVAFDSDRRELGQAIQLLGAAGFGVGILLIVVGIISLSIGGSRARRAMHEALAARRTPDDA